MWLKPKIYGILVQWAQYNKFVESGSIDFQSEETVITYIDHSWILKQFGLLQCSLSFFRSLFHEESFTLYILFWIIFTLHLLIIQTFTWVLVPSNTLSSSLSCGSQGSTIQRPSPHKCGQKSSYSAFNRVVVAFP